MSRIVRSVIGVFGVFMVGMGGCATAPSPAMEELRIEARLTIEEGLVYEDNPAIRSQAVEATAEVLEDAALQIRQRLEDEHPGVRFAACMALGELRDRDAVAALRKRTQDEDASVRVAAYFALERLGIQDYRRPWADALMRSPEAAVRRNAALAFGRLGDPSALPLLNRAGVHDDDEGVRLQVREAMAVLGDADTISRFVHDAYGGAGFRQPFAILTLGQVKDHNVLPTLRRCLDTSPYRETQLAAARALAMHGYAEGYNLALRSLRWNQARSDLPDDPPRNQIRRVRSMAIMALGEIGNPDALGPLYRLLAESDDPQIQLTAATAILKILNAREDGMG